MITFDFTVRDDQGEPSQFDLGDMTVHGDQGSASSEHHTPDQGMMIYLSVADLLYQLRRAFDARGGSFEFVGTDSSFRLLFKADKSTIKVAAPKQPLATVPRGELLSAALTAARSFAEAWLPLLAPTDGARLDLEAEMRTCAATLAAHGHLT